MKNKNTKINIKKKKKVKLIYKIVVGILFLVSIIFIIGLMSLNVLTMKLFMLAVGFLLFIDFLFWLFIIKSKIKKESSLIATIAIILLSLGNCYLFKTNGFLEGMISNHKTYNYSIIVLKESEHKKIKDLNKLTMGYLSNDLEETSKSLEYINDIITPKYKKYKDSKEMIEELLDKKTEAIIMEDSYFAMLKEENASFESNIRVVKKFSIRIKIKDFTKDIDVAKNTFNIFISGIDTYGTVDSVSRSDVNMVVTVNPKTKQILLTSIPRDYYVTLHEIKGYNDKITHAGLYGIDMSVKTVEDLLDIEINYYVKVNFTSVIDIVDALNNVEVYSDYTFTSMDGYNYTEGYNKVNGEEALSFARERKAFRAGDNQRIKNQQALLQAIFKKCISKDIIYKYNKLLNSLDGSFVTNMPTDRITSLIKMQLKDMASWTITTNSLTGENSSNYTYSYTKQKLYVMKPDQESVEEAHELIVSVTSGEVLENSYTEKTGASHTVTQKPNSTNATEPKKENESTNLTKEETSKEEKKEEIKQSITSQLETNTKKEDTSITEDTPLKQETEIKDKTDNPEDKTKREEKTENDLSEENDKEDKEDE